jgi:entericidin B
MALKEAGMKAILLLVALALSGCNTVEGIGKDLKQGGEAIERAATKK